MKEQGLVELQENGQEKFLPSIVFMVIFKKGTYTKEKLNKPTILQE